MTKQTKNEAITPPIKPSTVFFGESLINGVLPRNTPKK